MKHIYLNNREYVLSRQWPDRDELVDVETGEIYNVPKADREAEAYRSAFFNVERPLSAAFQSYRSRSPEFLTQLRELRTRVLLGKPPKKTRKKAEGSKLKVVGGKASSKRGRSKRALEVPEALLMHLPPEVRAEIMQKVKGLNK